MVELDEQSHDSYEIGGKINSTSSGRLHTESTHHNGGDDDGHGRDDGANRKHFSKENSKPLKDAESGVKAITERLESLLLNQQMEVDELKKKHRLAISDLLNNCLRKPVERSVADKSAGMPLSTGETRSTMLCNCNDSTSHDELKGKDDQAETSKLLLVYTGMWFNLIVLSKTSTGAYICTYGSVI
ncbi:uncharacterized protein LOC120151965 [Hibiscus syriacus]|uniref:uncharacterized protein LOC120151965 n=1 Tax=Hibiscus syriacus TaxID=106335 RepID=UPI00192441BB|nr:uncharacterized protein LOC120151965 [Hibiscus syriacus]